jgi:hypothetical protein
MPRPKTPALTYEQLVAMLGRPMRERSEFVAADPTSPQSRRKVHRGWSWPCGCAAFAREEADRYLYVPCIAHSTPRRRGGSESAGGNGDDQSGRTAVN